MNRQLILIAGLTLFAGGLYAAFAQDYFPQDDYRPQRRSRYTRGIPAD